MNAFRADARPCGIARWVHPSHGPLPSHSHEPRILGKGIPREIQGKSRMLTQNLGASSANADAPRLALDRVGFREGVTGEDGQVRASAGVPDGDVSDHLGVDVAGHVRQILARAVLRRMGPKRLVLRESARRQIDRNRGRDRCRECGVFRGIVRKRGFRALGVEEKAVERDFGCRCLRILGPVPDPGSHTGAAKAGAVRVGPIPERGREQVVEVTALLRNRRFGFLQDVLEERLLAGSVDELHRRDHVLGFDQTPSRGRIGTRLRPERVCRPGRP
jgi:ribosomal protein L34E